MPKITKNSRGTWEFVVDLGNDPATGKRRQARRSGFRTKKEAEEELRRLQNEADKGVVVKKREGNITFEEFSQDWLEWYAATAGVKPSTIESRENHLKRINKWFGMFKIKDINKAVCDRFLMVLYEKYAPNTANSTKVTVSLILDYAVQCGFLTANPINNCKRPKSAPKLEDVPEEIEAHYLSRAEVGKLLKTTELYGDVQSYVLLTLLIMTGLRIGEALALEFKHIDFENSIIKVRQTFSVGAKTAKAKQLQTPKTASSIRDVELEANTLELLRFQILEQKKKRLKAGANWNAEHEFLFTGIKRPGERFNYSTIARRFERLLNLAEIDKKITLHGLRHTHASLLAESGATLEQIQARLGHSGDEITRKIYLHITKDASSKVIADFARLMKM